MKLYILYNSITDKVVAISEVKEYIYRYIIQNNFPEEYKISKIKKQNEIDRFLIVYDELLLEEVDEFVLTSIESRLINRTMEEELSKIEDVIDQLSQMLKDYNFSKKDRDILFKAVKVLNKNIKPKKLPILLKIKEFIFDLFIPNNRNIIDAFTDEINAKETRYYIHINISDK